MFRYLLRLCHPREGDEYRVSPLPAGANDGDDIVPQYLDINGRNSVGATPLELAASQGHLEVVRYYFCHMIIFICWEKIFHQFLHLLSLAKF